MSFNNVLSVFRSTVGFIYNEGGDDTTVTSEMHITNCKPVYDTERKDLRVLTYSLGSRRQLVRKHRLLVQ